MSHADRLRLLREIQELQFTAVELQLFLDTHPDERRALADYVAISKQLRDAIQKYDEVFGPLIGYGISQEELNKGYRWLDYWPWEDLGGNR